MQPASGRWLRAVHALVRAVGDDETPLKVPRDSTRSALLTAVRSRLTGLAVHLRRVLHGLAAPDWPIYLSIYLSIYLLLLLGRYF